LSRDSHLSRSQSIVARYLGTGSLTFAAVVGRAAGAVLLSGSTIAQAQSSSVNALLPLPPGSPAYLKETWRSALTAPMRFGAAPGVIPALLPQSFTDPDPLGTLGSYQLNGPTQTAANAFFQPLGTNGRTCGSCHVPSQGMGVSVDDLRDRFDAYGPRDPVFAPVDGANCPGAVSRSLTSPSHLGNLVGEGTDDEEDPRPYSLVLSRGVFRIFLPLPANAEFTVKVVRDTAGCNVNEPMCSRARSRRSGRLERARPSAAALRRTTCRSSS
jgi:hypothetical protein